MRVWKTLLVVGCILFNVSAEAYTKVFKKDGKEAEIYCDNHQLADTYEWNGSQWSNGIRWGKDLDALAKQSVAANGAACT